MHHLLTIILPSAAFILVFLAGSAAAAPPDCSARASSKHPPLPQPVLHARVEVPESLLTTDDRGIKYGGDIRLGDLNHDGRADFLVYRSAGDVHDGGGVKPVFMGAFDMEGNLLWQAGAGGSQPSRPGPVAIHDIDGDGRAEVVAFFKDPGVDAPASAFDDVVIQIRDGATGEVKKEARPSVFDEIQAQGANGVHQRLLMANFRGLDGPRDFVVKLGAHVLAFNNDLELLWRYESPWTEYARCPAYIPAVGDIDGDGKDEVNGGYMILDDDGAVLWEEQLARNMDSVAIDAWDDGAMRAFCSGGGHVLTAEGETVLALGEEIVPHGQELRVARFLPDDRRNQMVIRHRGHATGVLVVNVDGEVVNRFDLNRSPNNTGMEAVLWRGPDEPAVLYNGGMLWDAALGEGIELPGLPEPGGGRMGWFHCIPADLCGDAREEIVVYNPWAAEVFVYTPKPVDEDAYQGYSPGPVQYNVRLMD
jgi:hypothetical protein